MFQNGSNGSLFSCLICISCILSSSSFSRQTSHQKLADERPMQWPIISSISVLRTPRYHLAHVKPLPKINQIHVSFCYFLFISDSWDSSNVTIRSSNLTMKSDHEIQLPHIILRRLTSSPSRRICCRPTLDPGAPFGLGRWLIVGWWKPHPFEKFGESQALCAWLTQMNSY